MPRSTNSLLSNWGGLLMLFHFSFWILCCDGTRNFAKVHVSTCTSKSIPRSSYADIYIFYSFCHSISTLRFTILRHNFDVCDCRNVACWQIGARTDWPWSCAHGSGGVHLGLFLIRFLLRLSFFFHSPDLENSDNFSSEVLVKCYLGTPFQTAGDLRGEWVSSSETELSVPVLWGHAFMNLQRSILGFCNHVRRRS